MRLRRGPTDVPRSRVWPSRVAKADPPGRHSRHPQKTSRGVITGRRCRMATMGHRGIVRFGQTLGRPFTPSWN